MTKCGTLSGLLGNIGRLNFIAFENHLYLNRAYKGERPAQRQPWSGCLDEGWHHGRSFRSFCTGQDTRGSHHPPSRQPSDDGCVGPDHAVGWYPELIYGVQRSPRLRRARLFLLRADRRGLDAAHRSRVGSALGRQDNSHFSGVGSSSHGRVSLPRRPVPSAWVTVASGLGRRHGCAPSGNGTCPEQDH